MTTTSSLEDVVALAADLARDGVGPADAAEPVLAAAGGDRRTVEAARDRVAARVHAHVDDFDATLTLQLLNSVLARLPIYDPLDWRVLWTQRFRRP
jgi:sirohydrochlorin ferrochelatase